MVNNKRKIKRIGIDARFYGPLGKGLGRYTKEVVDRVLEMDTENEFVIFLTKENFEHFTSGHPRVKKVLIRARWYSVLEQTELPLKILKERIDLMHFPHFNVPLSCPCRFVVTIHDLILTKFPTQRASTLGPAWYKVKNLGYRAVIRNAVKRSEKVIAVSIFTKNDIIGQFRVDPAKIAVTHEGVAKPFLDNKTNDDKKVLLGYNIRRPYLLYVGNAYPHKNLELLISIIPDIRKKIPDISLVLVGKEDYFYNRLKNFALKHSSSIIFPGFIPDEELSLVYRNAVLYVFPSLYEGFGLPPLEAMANACPVISSNKASMPEILGRAAAYFDPEDKDEMVSSIVSLAGDESTRKMLAQFGRQKAKQYSWQKCAEQTLNIYNELLRPGACFSPCRTN